MPRLRTSDGRTLAWRQLGSGPPLLCHPGGPGFSSGYFGEQPELAAERTLILLDPRGTGGSDPPPDPAGYGLESYAADVEAVREHLALDRLDLLGHSHGGFVAIVWAGRHSHRARRLVLAGTAPRFSDTIRQRRMARAASHRGRPYFDDAVAALEAQQAGRYASAAELQALYARAAPVLMPPDADLAPIADTLGAAGINADALRHFNTNVAPSMDLRPLLRRIEAATLVIAGDLDPFGGPTLDDIAGALPDATVVVVPGADHFPFLEPEHRATWARAVLEFLQKP